MCDPGFSGDGFNCTSQDDIAVKYECVFKYRFLLQMLMSVQINFHPVILMPFVLIPLVVSLVIVS